MLDFIRENKGRIQISKLVAPAFRKGFFLNFHGRYRIFKGARNTGKSHTFNGFEPIIKIISDPRRNIVVVRQNNNSNRTSTFPNLLARIDDLGLSDKFSSKDSSLETSITYKPTKQKIIFKGFDDPQKITSTTFQTGYFTDVYIEEAFEIESPSDFRKLDGSLRGKLPDGLFQQITLSFNAWSKEHWIYDKFFKGRLEDDFDTLMEKGYQEYCEPLAMIPDGYGRGVYLHTSSYKCNPWRDTEDYDEAMEEMRSKSLDIFMVEGLGMWGNSTSQTYPEFKEHCVMPLSEIKKRFGHFATFAIGVDTGLSNGEGRRRTVKKNENPDERIKSAHAVTLAAVSANFESIVILEEYFHTEIEHNGDYNTDERGRLGEPELLKRTADYICQWIDKYKDSNMGIMGYRQPINIFVDNEDIGFMQMLQKEFELRRMWNVRCYQSTKLSVQTRADFEKIMMAWGDFVVADHCRNVVREFRDARRDPKGRARSDGNDHALTSLEYAFTPLLGDVHRWKNFKSR